MDLAYALLLVATLLVAGAAGSLARRRLDPRHLSPESIDSIRLIMGMLLTFSALVLGLLTSNAKQRFDGLGDDLAAFSADLIQLDHRLRTYGPDAAEIRTLLRQYTAAAIADSWPAEPRPTGDYPTVRHTGQPTGIEAAQLGALLDRIDERIAQLAPADDFHRQTAARLRDRVTSLIQRRWNLILTANATIAWPFLLTLAMWLSIIFAIFGMTSPPGRVVRIVMALAALSIASPLYLIVDYSGALEGAIALSSQPMRAALAHMDAPQP